MKINNLITSAFVAAAVSAAAVSTASAQNVDFDRFEDLTIFFQDTALTQTLIITLDRTNASFRDATGSSLNFLNIGGLLNTTFGATWFDQTTLRAGLAGVANNNPFSFDTIFGDTNQTIYTSRRRNTTGANTFVVGASNSTAISLTGAARNTVANNINSMFQNFEQLQTSGTSRTETFPSSPVDNFNVGTTSFTNILNPGVQFSFASGNWGTYGTVVSEAVLDLYRIDNLNPGGGEGSPNNSTGTYEGSITLDQSGNVSFIAVPEPTTFALIGLAGAAFFTGARRRKTNS